MNKFTELLQKRVAGVPVLVPIAIFAGILVWYAVKASPTVSTDPGQDADPLNAVEGQDNPVFVAKPAPAPGDTDQDGTVTPDDSGTYDDNEAWMRKSVDYLVKSGVSATLATEALRIYITGGTLSYNQGKLVDQAIAARGAAPYPTGKTTTDLYTGPASKQGTPPTTHTVKGASDNTPSELALLYYSTNSAAYVQLIKSAGGAGNTVNNRDVYTPGDTITIPAPAPVSAPIGNPTDLINVPIPSGGSATKVPDSLKGKPALYVNVPANMNMVDFQKRVYAAYGFIPSVATLKNLNPSKPLTIDKMNSSEVHGANELMVKAAG